MVRAVTPIPFVKARFFDRCGKPLAGGKVYTYEANTTTPKVTYKDPYGLTPNTNPIILDAAGEADIYLDGTYRIRITDRNDVLVNDVEKIGSWFSDNLQDTLDNISGAMDDALKPILQNLDEAINAAAAAGAGANGWDANLVAYGEITQKQINDGLESIAQLIAVKNPRNGMRVYVKGYHKPTLFVELNPYKGGNLFVYDATVSRAKHDGGTVIDPNKVFPTDWKNRTQVNDWFLPSNTGTGCWVLQYDGAVNVLWFGARPDFSVGIDNSIAINKALSVKNNIFLPSGNYIIHRPILTAKANAVIKGDGIGPEIVTEAMKVLDAVAKKYNHKFNYTEILMGGCSIDAYGVPLSDEALKIAKKSDSVLLGAIGGNTTTSPWYKLEPSLRPEAGLLKIRKELGLFANLRPAYLYDELKGACPLKEELTEGGFDMMIMRELTGGLYFGERSTEKEGDQMVARDSMSYSESEIRRIAKRGFDIAMKRNKKVTSVDKANVLDTSRLWRKVVEEVAKEYPEVTLEHMLVDNCAMQLVRDPKQFDVILTENMFGDILSDEASMVTGSIGMLSSASLREDSFGMYEPSHGSAPDIAGQNIANPIATILSAAMMLRYSFDLDQEAKDVEDAIEKVLKEGYRTTDIMSEGKTLVGTREMGDLIVSHL